MGKSTESETGCGEKRVVSRQRQNIKNPIVESMILKVAV